MRRRGNRAGVHHTGRRVTAAILATLMAVGCVRLAPLQFQADAAQDTGYEIYPNPHVMEYTGGSYIVDQQVNVVVEEGIDTYTQDRLEEVLNLKGITYTTSQEVVENQTNILVGIEGSQGYVDTYADRLTVTTQGLFDKLDSYVLDSQDGVITVLGRDTDAAFYGLTTLYHVFTQMDSFTIREFHVEDWADVASRGFIEGYYGNPWSTEDRVNLMTWAGYYKLNSYFYAPKDDPKHNSKWKELYTEEELKTLIEPLAEAGNRSKCQFVFALHPYMYDPIRESNYEEYYQILTAKFLQVIEHGVRQIAVLADDAGVPDNKLDVQIRLLTDLTNWVSSEEMQQRFPGLKVVIPFCPNDYMGGGGSQQLQTLGEGMPETVPLVVTGGKVWGEVSQSFTTNFTNGVGRGPYMWINWPCTDNSKKHLIMGGYSDFLQIGVDPSNIQGIVLNPMQQSEPSKVAIFGNACYSWNIWESQEEADRAWDASFACVDHNSVIPNDASDALRELSKHMINQAMDNRVRVLQESVVLKTILNPFKEKLAAGTVTTADVDTVMAEFELLQQAAQTYRAKAGDQNLSGQIVYWLDCWDDTTEAALAYLNGVKAVLANDTTGILQYNTQGKVAFDRSKTHKFWYIDHYEQAEVGVQHIVPFINTLASYMSQYAEMAMDPSKAVASFITNRTDNPVNGTDKALDGDDSTFVSYQATREKPNSETGVTGLPTCYKDDYVGVLYNKVMDVDNIRFLLGNGKNHYEASKLQYTLDGEVWEDIPLTGMTNAFTGVEGQYLEVVVEAENLPQDFQAMGLRLIATANNLKDAYLNVHEIQINKVDSTDELQYNVIRTSRWTVYEGSEGNLYDGNDSTFIWYNPKGSTGNSVEVGDYLGYDLGGVFALDSAHIVVGNSGGDKITRYAVQTSVDNQTWTDVEGYEDYHGVAEGTDVLDIDLQGVEARYIRLYNLESRDKWIKFSEFTVTQVTGADAEHVYTNVNTDILATVENGVANLTSGTATLNEGDYVGVDLGSIKSVTHVTTSSLPQGVELQTSRNGVEWTPYVSRSDTDARYVRMVSTTDGVELNLTQFEVGFFYVGDKSVDSDFNLGETGRDMRSLNNVGNVFDGDLTTYGEITGPQTQGKHITFDLGQVIHFDSLRYYIVETNRDYLRHAMFQVSVDGENWTDVMEVGNSNFENVQDESVAKDAEYLTHDSSNPGYMYADAGELNVDGRYIRITPLTTYSGRWVLISELMINGGAYISTESGRDILSEVEELPGHLPSYALDGDYNTTYKPSQPNGSFTYYISAPQGLTTLRMIQMGQASGAQITANCIDGTTQQLGTLSQAINEFLLPQDKTVDSITVTWGEIAPELAEIVTSTQAVQPVDKTALKAALDTVQPTETWIRDSVNAYESAKAVAQEAYDNASIAQSAVDSALGALNSTVSSAVLKATNLNELNQLVAEKVFNDTHIYTAVTYANYAAAVDDLALALADADNLSQTKADQLRDEVVAAHTALEFSTYNREVAQTVVKGYDQLDSASYTQSTFDAVTQAKQAIDQLVAQDTDDNRVNPQQFIDAVAAYQAAVDALANITQLQAEIDKAGKMDASLYEETSFQTYLDAVEAGRQLLTTGTQEQVKAAVEAIQAAFDALELNPDTPLGALVAQARALNAEDYTTDSYAALMTLVEQAENDPADSSYLQKIDQAIKDLVDVTALNTQLAAAQKVDQTLYTKDSYQVLANLVAQVEPLLRSGTRDQVKEMTDKLDQAIRGLVVRATGVEAYRQGIVLKAADGYTAESYALYKQAYDQLMQADPANLSPQAFAQLKADFEQAEAGLKQVQTQNPGEGTQNPGTGTQEDGKPVTGDTMNMIPYVVILVVCAAALGALLYVKIKQRKHD